MKLETDRLIIRELSQDDYAALSSILQDEQTMYAYNGAFSDAETQEWLDKQLNRYKNDGFGLWAVVLKESKQMIGQCGLTLQPVNDLILPEIGYLFNRRFWGCGYATEAVMACKQYAFDCLGFSEVYSIIRETNLPSINVAKRNGMVEKCRFVKHYREVDMAHIVFSVRNDAEKDYTY